LRLPVRPDGARVVDFGGEFEGCAIVPDAPANDRRSRSQPLAAARSRPQQPAAARNPPEAALVRSRATDYNHAVLATRDFRMSMPIPDFPLTRVPPVARLRAWRALCARLGLLAVLALLPACAQLPFPGRPAQEPPAPEEPEVAPPPMAVDPIDPRVELLWDTYGVPHIFADDEAALFYAFGFAQMRSHADLLLRLYGQARGRAAEYWGDRFIDSDVWIRTNGVPERAERWTAQQPAYMRALLDAFADGINRYAELHPDSIGEAWRVVLPVRASDVLAHQQRVINYSFLASPGLVNAVRRQWLSAGTQDGDAAAAADRSKADAASGTEAGAARAASPAVPAAPAVPAVPGVPAAPLDARLTLAAAGSNAWAVAPRRTEAGHTLLLANPHLPWGDLYTWYEAHLVAPSLDAYGATLVGFPTLAIAFTEHIGWTHTVNTIDGADLYELTTTGDAYMFDEALRAFETEQQVLLVRQADGSLVERPLTVRRSVHGPVVAERPGRALALRVAGIETPHLFQQYWDMVRSTQRVTFEAVLGRLQLAMFSVIYADRHGDILHVFNGTVPVRRRGDWSYWQGIVPGDTSATLWTSTYAYHSLPRVLNPPSGWLQNANDPPWTTTYPYAIDAAYYPAYMAPRRPLSARAQRSARMLHESPRLTFERMVELKHSTRMETADHLVQDLVAATRALGDSSARAAADVLERWDRHADADSRGAVLYAAAFRTLQRQRWPTGSLYEIPWTPRAPFTTPDGLANPRMAVNVLSQAAQQVTALHGSLDVAWGEVHRLRRDTVDLPGNGGGGDLGIFRVVDYDVMPGDTTRLVAGSGDSWVGVVEFSQPVRARALLTYGNASQPGSPHRTDQLELFARKQLRTVWLTREEVMQNLSGRNVF
jgi:acyl-homoserine-lactone acylase